MSEIESRRIMVAIDESECSYRALIWALKNLKNSITSPVLLFTVQPVSNLAYITASSLGGNSIELIRTVQEQQSKASTALLEKAKRICADHGQVEADTMTEVAEPKEAICEAVEKYSMDLLIMGNHGRGALKRAFLGSISSYCVENAKCPVLVVKNYE